MGGAGGTMEKHEQEKTAMYKRNLLEVLSGQWGREMATGCQHWGGSGKQWGQWKARSLTLRVQLLLSSSQSPSCRNEGPCSTPAFYEEKYRLCWCKIP